MAVPALKTKAIFKAFISMGYEFKRCKGSHQILRKGDKTCVLPSGRNLAKGTLRRIMDTTGEDLETIMNHL